MGNIKYEHFIIRYLKALRATFKWKEQIMQTKEADIEKGDIKEKHYLLQYNNYSPPWFLHRSIQIFHWSKQAVNNFWTHIHGLRCRFICHSFTVSNLLLFVALKKSHGAILCLVKILLTNTAVWPGILTNNNDFFITTNSVITRILNRRFFQCLRSF